MCSALTRAHHSIIDAAEYVPREQLDAWAARDPIQRYRAALEAEGLWDDEQEARLTAELGAEIDRAIQEADAMEDPRPADVHEGVFA